MNRSQIVKYKNFQSNIINVTSGIPQGDHLSTLLFLLFINEIVNVIKYFEVLILADDAKLFKPIQTPSNIFCLQSVYLTQSLILVHIHSTSKTKFYQTYIS